MAAIVVGLRKTATHNATNHYNSVSHSKIKINEVKKVFEYFFYNKLKKYAKFVNLNM
jgi:hypothetical protein